VRRRCIVCCKAATIRNQAQADLQVCERCHWSLESQGFSFAELTCAAAQLFSWGARSARKFERERKTAK
jgi:hypothetical protein